MAEINENNTPEATTIWYQSVKDKWELSNALCSHTDGMREKRTTYLPMYGGEDSNLYQSRLDRTFLYEAYADTLDRIVSKPYSQPVTVSNAGPLEYMVEDVDGKGLTLTELGKQDLKAGVKYGLDFLFVDYPNVGKEAAAKLNKRDIAQKRIRPYIYRIAAENMLFWWVDYIDGYPIFREARFKEFTTVKSGFGESKVEEIVALRPNEKQTWVKDDKGIWNNQGVVPHTFPGIPIVPYYTNQKGFFQAEPPLLKLAWKNIEHWQLSSSLNDALYYAAGVFFGAGWVKTEIGKGLTLGHGRFRGSTNPEATLTHVEPGGKSIEILIKHLAGLHEEMTALGAMPFMRKRANVTATGEHNNESKAMSDVKSWTIDQEAALTKAFQIAAQWEGTKLPEDFKIDIYNDFLPETGLDDMEHVKWSYEHQLITGVNALIEEQRRGIISEAIEPETEISNARDEYGKTFLTLPGFDNPPADPNADKGNQE